MKLVIVCITLLSIPLFAMDTTRTCSPKGNPTVSTIDSAARGTTPGIGDTFKQIVGRLQTALDVWGDEEEIMREGTLEIIDAIRKGSSDRVDEESTPLIPSSQFEEQKSDQAIPVPRVLAQSANRRMPAPRHNDVCYSYIEGTTLKIGFRIQDNK